MKTAQREKELQAFDAVRELEAALETWAFIKAARDEREVLERLQKARRRVLRLMGVSARSLQHGRVADDT